MIFSIIFTSWCVFHNSNRREREHLDVKQRRMKWKEALTPLSKDTGEFQAQEGLGEHTEAVGKTRHRKICARQCLSTSLTDSQEGGEWNKPDLKKEKSRHCFWNRRVSPKFELSEGYSLYNMLPYKNHFAISILDVKFPWLSWVLVKNKGWCSFILFFFKLFSNYNCIFWQIPSISTVCFFRLPTIH